MGFPAGPLADKEEPVAIRTQIRGAALAICESRPQCPSAEHRKPGELGIEIDDAWRPHRIAGVEVGRALAGVVNIEIDMVTGDRRAQHHADIHGVEAVPCPARDERDHPGVKLKGLGRAGVAHDLQDHCRATIWGR
jgi:hypothetical protein